MDKVFKPENKHKLDSDQRRKLVPPEAVLDLMEIEKGDTLLDVGAGIGYFAVPAVRYVGPGGKVIAADISREMLDETKRRAAQSGVTVDPLLCGADRIPLPDAAADKILLAFVLHEVDDRAAYLREMRRLLKDGGALTIVEWDTIESPMGPPQSERISRRELESLIGAVGYVSVKDAQINDYQYACVMKKK
jgi:ubiquinone/menaquinone biosynthesis C-methylase UbiE